MAKRKHYCDECHILFLVEEKRYNQSKKKGHMVFCSSECRITNQRKKSHIDVKCEECGKTFSRAKHEINDKMFCSKKCSLKNLASLRKTEEHKKLISLRYPNRIKKGYNICSCGESKSYQAFYCNSCRKKETIEKAMGRTIKEMTSTGNARVKYSQIRSWAKKLMSEVYKIDKKCEICGFDVVVEVCHIKPLSEFSENELMGVANARENLKYLCPNHHAMFDKGLLKI